jgi:gliding motility-associated transport system ATP-binding protein
MPADVAISLRALPALSRSVARSARPDERRDAMIEALHLTKEYGPLKAVDDVSFRVEKGEIVGFLGPNGAGKSTTLRILAGFLGATRGTVKVAGQDVADAPTEARAAIGYMPETSPLYPEMRVREYLGFRAELKRVPRAKRRAAVDRVLTLAKIEDVGDVVIGHLSKGYRQRVGLADALVAAPPVLILDEPTAGLDPNQIREVRALVRGLAGEHTVLLSTHILSEVEATCGRALVIARGKLVAEGSIDDIRRRRRSSGARVVVRGDAARALEVARAVPGVTAATSGAADDDATALELEVDPAGEGHAAVEGVVAALVTAGLGVREVAPRRATLEQVFSELTAEGGGEAPS